jgi:hypothetical protein
MKKQWLPIAGGAFVLLAVFVALTCQAETPGKPKLANLAEGGTAYIRVKECSAKPIEDATPKGDEAKFAFAEEVKLNRKKEGLPALWLVSRDKVQAWVPAYVLTANKAEISFLKDKDRIPQTMTFMYSKDEILKVWGRINMGFYVVESKGMAMLDYAEGSSPVAFKGNAVLFDESAAKRAWKKPVVFAKGNIAYKPTTTHLYYCISEGDKPAFDCIDLINLKFCK